MLPVLGRMNPTTRPIEILYCPKCKVGIDAELTKQAACPSCGGRRKLMLGAERWLPIEGSSGLAEQLFAQRSRPVKIDVLIQQAQDYFFH